MSLSNGKLNGWEKFKIFDVLRLHKLFLSFGFIQIQGLMLINPVTRSFYLIGCYCVSFKLSYLLQ